MPAVASLFTIPGAKPRRLGGRNGRVLGLQFRTCESSSPFLALPLIRTCHSSQWSYSIY